jgi:hypothetical protein
MLAGAARLWIHHRTMPLPAVEPAEPEVGGGTPEAIVNVAAPVADTEVPAHAA